MKRSYELAEYRLNGRTVHVEIYRPRSTPVTPAILYLHEIYGVIDAYREDAEELASRGYRVFLPNLYSGGMARKYCVRAAVTSAGRLNSAISPLYKEIAELLRIMRAEPSCDGTLGMIGMCLTGGFVIQAAMREGVEAPVIYHHSLGLQGAGVPSDEEPELAKIQRMQGHWSRVDPFCPAPRRERLKRLLGDRLDDFVYNIPHGFRSLARKTDASALAWRRTLAFFDQNLGSNAHRSTATES